MLPRRGGHSFLAVSAPVIRLSRGRSRLNGRLRSLRPAATLTARVQPAMGRLVRITTFASCCSPASGVLSPALISPMVASR